jgi:dipeptidyl aminopeptidase/acylaminoacyl peptidase
MGKEGPYSSVSGKFEIWSIKPDGTDNRLELIDTAMTSFPWKSFCWSPDGGSIAWVRNYPEGYGEVMIRELATGKERQLTSDRKVIDEVTWATNNEILFISNKSGQSNLWMIPAGGGEATQVTQGAVPIMTASISADNKTLVYVQHETIGHIWISALDGSNAHQVTFDDVRVDNPQFSPDGKHISYIFRDVDPFNPEAHLYIMDRDGKNQRQLTSGSEIVLNHNWSLDGKWLAYSARMPAEPEDSNKVYLIQPFNPGPPRLLCKGHVPWWVDNERIVVYDGVITLLYQINEGSATKVYLDSTYAIPIQGNKQLFVLDFRKGREGWWLVSIDAQGKQKGEAKRVVPFNTDFAEPHDLWFLICKKGNELWRVWTSTGKEERIGRVLPGNSTMWNVSMDGKEIVWVKWENPSKLVLVKNVFE